MPGVKISELPAATTPLAGTELLAIVQGGVTKQASADAVLPTKISGNVSATAATPITVYTVAAAGAYYLYAYVSASGTTYRSVYLVTTDGTTAEVTALKAGTNLTVAMSGLNVQVTSAATAGVNWSIIQQTYP